MDHHGYLDVIVIIYRREFSVMSVVFSNYRVTHLRDLDAWDGFGNIRKRSVMIYERGNHYDKVRNSFGGVRNSFGGVRMCFGEVRKCFGVVES
jgi:hypothetical protein